MAAVPAGAVPLYEAKSSFSQAASPRLAEFGPGVEVPKEAVGGGPFIVSPEMVGLLVNEQLLTRTSGLLAYSGHLQFLPEKKRYRGRATEQPFGEGADQI